MRDLTETKHLISDSSDLCDQFQIVEAAFVTSKHGSNQIMKTVGLLLLAGVFAASCATTSTDGSDSGNNPFTHGNVQLNLEAGVTTQANVLEVFGAPNIATIDSKGLEMWTYQKNATVSSSASSSNYWTVVLVGGESSRSQATQSSRSMTMILKFDDSKTLVEFRSRTSSF